MSNFSESLKKYKETQMLSSTIMPLSLENEDSGVLSVSNKLSVSNELRSTDENWIRIDDRYRWYDDYHDDDISVIDDLKNITMNDKQINLTQESNSQFIPFEMNRFYDGFDLATTNLLIHFVNKNKNEDFTTPVNVKYNSDKIRFAWLCGKNATAISGELEFEIHAIGTNSKGDEYIWKTRPNGKLNILKSLEGDGVIEPDASWTSSFLVQVTEKVAEAQAAANEAQNIAKSVQESANQANNAVKEVQGVIDNAKIELANSVDAQLGNYAKKSEIGDMGVDSVGNKKTVKQYVDDVVAGVDVSEQLKDYAKSADVYTKSESDAKYATDADVESAVAAADISGKLDGYYKKEETYNKTEIDEKVSNVTVDLSGYATETYVNNKTDALTSSINENASGITSLNGAVADINKQLESVDKSPRLSYEATYGDVEMDDGSIAEYMFTLWETDGTNEPTVKSRFQIMGGGGGTGGSVILRIAYVEGYTTPLVSTINDSVIVKYDFSGEDSAGDTNLDGTASWKVGNRVVATQDVSTGIQEFDLTDFVNVGDNKVVLTITHATGAVATKAWTVKVVDVRLSSNFDDTKINIANEPVNFTYTPYGSVNKTVHFLLDGVEIATKTSVAASAGLSDSYSIPAKPHGTHLFEVYMTAEINGKTIESNHIVKDIIWFDNSSTAPVISCIKQNITIRQYEATNIQYTVFDPATETPSVTLRATYVNTEGETVEEFTSNLVLQSNTQIWQYKSDVIGEHILTISCGETVKTLNVTVTELGIDIVPITTGLAFDFNPVGYSNNDADRLWTYRDTGIKMTVSDNFDWTNGGYVIDEDGDQCFLIKAGTSATINYELFGDDAKANGKEFKLIFRTNNVANADTSFLSCVSDTMGTDKVGINMKAHEAIIYAKTDSLPLPYSEEEIIEFEFNISTSTEIPSMVMGYEDGVSTRPLVYDATHDFQQHKDHRKYISLGSDDCDLYIYRFKVYNTSLSTRDILNNFIADARSAEEMINRYTRNQIYQDGILTPEHLAEVCPQLRVIKLECPRFTQDKKDKVAGTTIECIYKNGDPILDNWVAYDCLHSGQGTSSNNYGPSGRNLDLIMKKDKSVGNNPYIILGDGTRTDKVSLTRDSVPVNYYNVKVNIASSENANNALLQKRYNAYNPYKRPIVRDTPEEAAKVKDTMEFYNCVVFLKESDTDLSTHVEFADNEWHLYAIGNIGDSKKTDNTRLTDMNDKYECILEVMDNTLPLSTMPTGKIDDNNAPVYPIPVSEWTVGNSAYDALQSETFVEASSDEKVNGLADTYGWRYIYENGTDEENAEVKSYVENKWREFYKFVVTSTDEEFKAHLGDYCVVDSILYYYMFVLRYTMVDNFAKNSFWHYGKTGEVDDSGNPIRKWDLCFDYDNDTGLGIDNYGRMSYRYGYEEIDYVDGTQDWVWNAPQHVFFLRIRKLFDAELCTLYTQLESLGAWSATSLINQFNKWQEQFPEELWRLDIERKYIRTYTSSFINGPARPEFLKERANGRKKTQRSQFERNQEKYMSSKFGGNVAAADDIIMRCSVPNETLAVAPNFDMHLTPYSHIYLNVKYNTSPPIRIRAVPNAEYTIKYDSELADIIEIYSASCLTSIGDLSACYLTNGDFSNASKIKELKLGNDTPGYKNSNEMTLGLGSNELLTKLDIQNMSGLTSSVDVSALKNLKEIYAFGSNVSGVIFADGGNISTVELPEIGSLQMKNLSYLEDGGFEVTSYNNLTRFVAENSKLDLVTLINNAPNLYQVRLIGLDWTLNDSSLLLERLYGLAGVTNTGANADRAILTGSVHVPVMREQLLSDYHKAWPDLDVTYDTLINQFAVTFINDDGTVLDIQYVDKGSKPVDPITRTDNPISIPIKESTVSTDFTFAGWDSSFINVFAPQTITATYSESLRKYTVKYVSKGTVLQESSDQYGSYVFYNGDIPTYTAEESAYVYYLFKEWDKSGFINGDKIINAVYDRFEYSDGCFDGLDISDMSPVQIYALTKNGKESDYVEIKDSISFNMGSDYNYTDIEQKTLISEKTVFVGTNYVDTGINLLDIDKDWTLAVDYRWSSDNANNAVLMQCYQGDGSNGFKLWNSTQPRLTWGTSSSTAAAVGNRDMIVLRHIHGETQLHVYKGNLPSEDVNYSTLSANKCIAPSQTLVFGCSKADDGMYENYSKGIIYWCKLWYTDLGDVACKNLALWTHETISAEMIGFKRFYLSDSSGKRCSMTFLGSHLLSNTIPLSNSTSNTGGFSSTTLNAFLNNRFREALPIQWKQLIKQVKVPSSSGNKSKDIITSDCYVFIPSIGELDASMQFEPYNYEGSPISYITSNATRLRKFDDGEAREYWTRSPNVEYSTYFYSIDADGNLNGFSYSLYDKGVLIQFSI